MQITEHIGRITDILVVVGPVMAGVYRMVRRVENAMAFTKTVAHEHLPHIYGRLRRSDEALGLVVPDHPDIVFVNGRIAKASDS